MCNLNCPRIIERAASRAHNSGTHDQREETPDQARRVAFGLDIAQASGA